MIHLRKKHAIVYIFLLILLVSMEAPAQVPDVQIYLIPRLIVVRVDSGYKGMNADVKAVEITIPGYYRIEPKVWYNSGDNEKNESFYMTVLTADSTISTPVDVNAGPYKVIPDEPGDRHKSWRDAGLFYFSEGVNIMKMHHYLLISDQYPQFLNGEIHRSESVKIVDSLKLIYQPQVDAALQLRASTNQMELINGENNWLAYPGEMVQYHMVIKNLSEHIIRQARLHNHLPAMLSPLQYSHQPQEQTGSEIVWLLPQIEPQDSLVISLTAVVPEVMQPGLTALVDKSELVVANDMDLTNNEDTVTIYALADSNGKDPEPADVGIFLTSTTDSVAVVASDTINIVRPGQIVTYRLKISNIGPDYARDVMVRDVVSPHLTIVQSSHAPEHHTNGLLIWNFTSLAPGSMVEIVFDGLVAGSIPNTDSLLISEASVMAIQDTLLDNNFATDTVKVAFNKPKPQPVRKVDLALTAEVISDTSIVIAENTIPAVVSGNNYLYRLFIENRGPVTAQEIQLWDRIPDLVSVSEFTSNFQQQKGNALYWFIDSLEVAGTFSLEFKVTVPDSMPYYPFELQHVSSITAKQDSTDANNQVQTKIYAVNRQKSGPTITNTDLAVTLKSITKTRTVYENTVMNAVQPGTAYQYQIDVANHGNHDSKQVRLVQTLPDFVHFLDATLPPVLADGDSLVWVLTELLSGSIRTIFVEVGHGPQKLQQHELRLSQVDLNAANDTTTFNNTAIDTVLALADLSKPKSRKFDVEIAYQVTSDTFVVIANERIAAAFAGDRFTYQLQIHNNGPATATAIQVSSIIPNLITRSDFSKMPVSQNGDTLFWTIDTLGSGDSWQTSFAATFDSMPYYPYKIASTGEVTAENDTVAANNYAIAQLYALEKNVPVQLCDIAVSQYVITDSLAIVNEDTLKYAGEGETYSYYILVENNSQVDAQNVVIKNVYPDSITIHDVDPTPASVHQDTITWVFETLAANSNRLLRFEATVPVVMPVGLNYLVNRVWLAADNEDATRLADNASTYTVYNLVTVPEVLDPKIEASPAVVDVTDSIFVRVQVPEHTISWDLCIYFPDGRTDPGFADRFIATTPLVPDEWVEVDEHYRPKRLITNEKEEEIIFEIQTRNNRGFEASARDTVIVKSGNHLVLDRNVFRPDLTDPIAIRFKLDNRRNAQLDVYDISGQHITKLVDDVFEGGWNSLWWDGKSHNGQKVGSGVYLVTLSSEDYKAWKKFLIVR